MTRMPRNRILGAGMGGNTISGILDAETLAASLPNSASGGGTGGFGARRGSVKAGARAVLANNNGGGFTGGSFNIGPINIGG